MKSEYQETVFWWQHKKNYLWHPLPLTFSWYSEIAFTSLSFRCHLRFLIGIDIESYSVFSIQFNAYVCIRSLRCQRLWVWVWAEHACVWCVRACIWRTCVFVCMMGRADFIVSIISFCSPNIKAIRRWFSSFSRYYVPSLAFARSRSHSYSHSCSHFNNLYESRTTILEQPFLRFFHSQFLCSFPPTFNGFECKDFAINCNSQA